MVLTTTRRAIAAATIMLAAASAVPGAAIAAGSDNIVVEDGESIQAAIDAAEPGTTITVRGDHVENIWINKDDISLVGRGDATITQPEEPAFAPCDFFGPRVDDRLRLPADRTVPGTRGPEAHGNLDHGTHRRQPELRRDRRVRHQ